MIALKLLLHITQGIEGTPFVEFVEGNQIGEIEHIDFFELGGGAVLGRHHIQAHIAVLDDFGIALTNTRCFEDDEVEARGLGYIHRILHIFAEREVALARGQRAHINAGVVDAVHPDAVAQQRATSFAFARVNRYNGDGFAFFYVPILHKIE